MSTEAMLRELDNALLLYRLWANVQHDSYEAEGRAAQAFETAAENFVIDHGPALAEVVRDAERLDWLEKSPGYNLVNDDDSRWAISTSGFQPVPDGGGFKEPVSIVSFVDPEEWQPSIRTAIDAARGIG